MKKIIIFLLITKLEIVSASERFEMDSIIYVLPKTIENKLDSARLLFYDGKLLGKLFIKYDAGDETHWTSIMLAEKGDTALTSLVSRTNRFVKINGVFYPLLFNSDFHFCTIMNEPQQNGTVTIKRYKGTAYFIQFKITRHRTIIIQEGGN